MSENIILDLACLSRGLPPLSMGPQAAMSMIKSMNSINKRIALRKIRKFAKLEVNRRCFESKFFDKGREMFYREALLQRINLSKGHNQSFRDRFILARIDFTKSYILNSLI